MCCVGRAAARRTAHSQGPRFFAAANGVQLYVKGSFGDRSAQRAKTVRAWSTVSMKAGTASPMRNSSATSCAFP